MKYRYKIGQNVRVDGPSGKYGHVMDHEIIDGGEYYSVWLYGDKPSDPEVIPLDHLRERIAIIRIYPSTIVSDSGGQYEVFDTDARARHKDGSVVTISATSTLVQGKRVYTAYKDGEGWGDFPEDHLV